MTWGEWCDMEECNEECPYFKADACNMSGMVCYGGEPIEPPCCIGDYPDDKDIEDIVKEILDRTQRYEEQEDRLIAMKKAKEERAKKAADTRRRVRNYCVNEIVKIKLLKKQIAEIKATQSFAESLAFAFNTTNETFHYEERVKPNPVFKDAIDEITAKLVVAE